MYGDGRIAVDSHLQIIRELGCLNPSQQGGAAFEFSALICMFTVTFMPTLFI